jgi:hypothetical protein
MREGAPLVMLTGMCSDQQFGRTLATVYRSVLIALLALAAAGCGNRGLPHEGKSVAQLQEMVASDNPAAQAQGALGLSVHGAQSRPAVESLVALLGSPRADVRRQSALALGKIGPDATDAVPGLTGLLDDPEWTVRRQAAMALGEIGAASRPALPALTRLSQDPYKHVSQAAREARARIEGSGN